MRLLGGSGCIYPAAGAAQAHSRLYSPSRGGRLVSQRTLHAEWQLNELLCITFTPLGGIEQILSTQDVGGPFPLQKYSRAEWCLLFFSGGSREWPCFLGVFWQKVALCSDTSSPAQPVVCSFPTPITALTSPYCWHSPVVGAFRGLQSTVRAATLRRWGFGTRGG